VFFSHHEEGLSLHEVLVTLFLFITAPVGAHLMAKAALHLRLQSQAKLPPEPLLDGAGCQVGGPAGDQAAAQDQAASLTGTPDSARQ
jgi:multicomponent K+:H+ antiporter subunit G